MHLVGVELALKSAVDSYVDRYAFVGCMRARDGGDVIQRVGEVNPRDLHRPRTRIDQEVGGKAFETLGFFRGDREHFFTFRFVLSRPGGGGQ